MRVFHAISHARSVRRSGRAQSLGARRLGALLLLLSLCGGPSHALRPGKMITQYGQDAWQAEQGLPQNSVAAIAQTRDGYLWLGTEEGLARFDGVSFKTFDGRSNPPLHANNVSFLFEDSQGTLWIGTSGGGLARYRDGKFTALTTKEGLSHNFVTAICEDAQGALWIATLAGLNKFEDGRFTRYTAREGLSDDRVAVVYKDYQGRLWAGTYNGLDRFHDGTFTNYPLHNPDGALDKLVASVFQDAAGTLWVGTKRQLRYLAGDKVVPYARQSEAMRQGITKMLQDRDGVLWMGTGGGGVLRTRDGALTAYDSANGISNDVVLSLCEDREGSLWVGTLAGLNRLKDDKFTAFDAGDGLTDEYVWAIYEGRDKSLWLGTDGGGLNRWKDNQFTAYTKRDGLPDETVLSIAEDRAGALWVGTLRGGLARFQDNRFTTYTTRDGLLSNVVRVIHEDRAGTLWVGTSEGVNRLVDGKFTALTTKDGLTENRIMILHEDRAGGMWIGTNGGGLNYWKDGKLTAYTTADGLSSDIIRSLYEDETGTLWVGTKGGGLNRFSGNKFTAFGTGDGLFDDTVFQILPDDAGNLWMSCNKGVFKVSVSELEEYAAGKIGRVHATSYSTLDGLPSNECNGSAYPAGTRTADGQLWFPTIKGAAVINPRDVRLNKVVPPVHVEEVVVNGEPTSAARAPLTLAPGSRSLEFHYTALSFVETRQVRFKYKLEGFDQDWVDAGVRRTAYYTSLPPGDYRFRVLAANNDGVWNETGAVVEFRLAPHFYQTLWFYALCTALAAALVASGFRLRVRQLKQRERMLVKVVRDNTRELAQANQTLHEQTRQLAEANQALAAQAGQLAEANQQLKQLSYVDGLTGVANRRHFDEMLEEECRRARRVGSALALILIDIDYFKAYNDAYGHQRGDHCLQQVANALNRVCRRSDDVVARYGGEEFAAVLPAADNNGAARMAEALWRSVAELAIPHEHSRVSDHVTISLGVALMPVVAGDIKQSAAELIAASDRALYEAKHAGRNCYRVAGAAALI